MFARTKRLTLRPGWPEDIVAMAEVIGADGMASLASLEDARGVGLLICAHEGGAPRLIGTIRLTPQASSHELAFWLAPDARGRGYATEAARAVVDMARHALPVRRLSAASAPDDAAVSVLCKLGFRDTGRREPRSPAASGRAGETMVMELDLDRPRQAMPIAA